MWLATAGLELGAVSVMLYGFREREQILDIFEPVTGLRMNHAYVRIGGVVMDLPEGGLDRIRDFLRMMPGRIDEYETLLTENPIWIERNQGVGRAVGRGCPRPRRDRPDRCAPRARRGTCGATSRTAATRPTTSTSRRATRADCYARYEVRMEEMRESLRIVEQCAGPARANPAR